VVSRTASGLEPAHIPAARPGSGLVTRPVLMSGGASQANLRRVATDRGQVLGRPASVVPAHPIQL